MDINLHCRRTYVSRCSKPRAKYCLPSSAYKPVLSRDN
jgi:hypothetical protein